MAFALGSQEEESSLEQLKSHPGLLFQELNLQLVSVDHGGGDLLLWKKEHLLIRVFGDQPVFLEKQLVQKRHLFSSISKHYNFVPKIDFKGVLDLFEGFDSQQIKAFLHQDLHCVDQLDSH